MKLSLQIRAILTITLITISSMLFAQTCPTISNITSSTAVCAGSSISLQVTATSPGGSPLTYAWFKNGSAIPNATNFKYDITNFQQSDADVYFVRVSNACNTPTQSADIRLTLKDKPSITSFSTSPQTICTGSNYPIQVSGNDNGGGTITYQWKKGASIISNANAATYTLSNIQSGDAALYSVTLSNGCGNVTSSDFQLNVNQKPSITVNPNPTNVLCAGATLTLNADVISATSYKWQKDGVDIGNTTKTLTIPSVAASNAGVYTFVATNDCGNSTSGTAQVTIKDKPSITSISAPTNVCAGATASLVATVVPNGDNNLTYAWALNGTAVPNGNGATLVVPNFQAANAGTYSFTVTNSCGSTSSATNNQNVTIQLITTPSIATISNQSVCINTSLLVTTTITNLGSINPTYQWYFNGSAISGQTSSQLNISNIQTNKAGRYFVTVNNGCTPTISSNEFNVTVLDAPTIQTHPTALTETCSATSFSLSVAANNTQSYQWLKNDVAINNATSSSYTIASVASSDAATYKVVVSNSCGNNVTSNAAVLVVKSAPTVQTSASSNTLCVGTSHTLQVSAVTNNGGSLTYQWKKGGVNIPNATTASLVLTNLQTSSTGIYTVDVTNSCGTTTSPDYTITVSQAPIITLDPVSQALCAGATATFTANVTGSTSVKWQKNGVDVGNTTTTLSLSNIAAANAGSYTLLATNSCGTTTSAVATLTVNNKPTINSLTSSSPVCAGATATITSAVTPNGDNNLTYSWSLNGTAVNGNLPTLSIPNFQSANAGTYALVVTNSCGSTTSSATTTLQLQPTPSVANIADQTVCQGGTLNVAPTYTNVSGGNVTYQWYFEGNLINNQNTAQLNISNITTSQAGRYFVTVNNGCIPVSGSPFNVNVLNLPTIQTQPNVQTEACVGTNYTLTVNATNAQTYQWYKNNVAIAGETTKTYSKSVSASDAGIYKVVITNGCGYSINSNNAILTVNTLPTITSSPANTTVCVGQPISASVSATANSGGNLRYIWTSGGSEIPGATSSNFTISKASSNENGKVYTVSVLNDCNIPVNGGSFTVTVGDKPKDVKITTSIPNNTVTGNPTVCVGSPITFSVESVSNGYNPSYTWYKDDVSKGTSSNSALSISSSATTDAGIYKLTASNTCGATTSNSITIGVHEKPIIANQPESSITACELTTVTLSGLAQNKPGTNSAITYTWYYNNNPFTLNAPNLILTNIKTDETGNYQLRASNECGAVSSNTSVLTVVSKPKYSIITPSSDLAICSATYQTKTISVNIFAINGATPSIVWSTSDGSITGYNTVGNTANVTVASVGKDATYNAELSNSCGTTVLQNFGVDGIKIKNESATPSVTTFTAHPLTTFCERNQIKLNVTTKSSAAETYTWKLNNVVVITQSGNTNSSDYTKANSTTADQGTYTVDITNKCGTLSNAVSIPVTVNPTPVVAFDVANPVTQCLSNNLFNFTNRTEVANGSTIDYVWQFGDGSINTTDINATTHSYANSGSYTVGLTGTNNYGCKNSTTKAVIVAAEPRITKQPVGGVVCQGNSNLLSAEINSGGATSLTYQWYFNNQPISNNHSNPLTLQISSMSASNAGTYYLKIINAQCNLSNESARVTVSFQEKPNPSFTAGGKSLTSCINDAEFTFINTTPAVANVSYLWNVSDGSTSRENNFTYKFTSTGIYEVSLTATAGGCSSEAVYILGNRNNQIRVNTTPTITTDLVSDLTIKKGEPINLSVNASHSYVDGTNPTPPITYQWYKLPSTSVIFNDRNFNSITSAVISDTGRYYVNVRNACGFVRSNIIKIKVIDKPSITIQPIATKVCLDKALQLTVDAISNDNSSPLYQWFYQQDLNAQPVPIANATGAEFNIAKFKISDEGHYYATLTNSVGTTTSDKVIVTANDVPIINSIESIPSIESGICINTALQLNATVSNIANSTNTISWEQNGVTLPGQSNLQINFAAIAKINNGDLILKVANACGTASKTVKIKVIDLPQFTQSPIAVTTCLNGAANFTAKVQSVTNGTPYGFQWLKNGNTYNGTGIISDEKLSLSNVQVADAGFYALQATNACGITTSATAKLTVLTAGPTITQQPTEISACVGAQKSASIIANSEDNILTYSWYKNGILIANEINPQLLFNAIATTDAGTYKGVVTNGCGLTTTSNNFIIVVKEKVSLNGTIANKELCVGNNLTSDISGFLNSADINTTYQWRLNDIDLTEASAKTNSLSLVGITKVKEGKYSVITNNSCGTSTLNLFSLKVNAAPEITTQPIPGLVCEGGSFTNNIIANNNSQLPLSYQWLKDGTVITNNGTAQQLQLQNISGVDQGLYAVRVSNTCGTTLSTSARLSLIGNPIITQQPAAINSCSGLENTATIVATSDDNRLTYKWFKNGSLIAGQIGSQLNFPNITATDAGSYKAIVTNGCNLSTTSSDFLVFVKEKIALNGSITNKQLCVGNTLDVDLSAYLTGTDVSSRYQWRLNSIDITEASAKTNRIQLLNVAKTNQGAYSLIATNGCGPSTLNLFNLTINTAPEITTQPVAGFVCEGKTFTNSVFVANATQLPLSYQWFKDGNSITNNATAQQLVLQNIAAADQGLYAVRVSNTCGTTLSSSARLSLIGNPVITQQPASITSCAGIENIATIVGSSDDNALVYKWYKDGILLADQISNQLIFSKILSTDIGAYKSVITNSCGLSATSNTFQVVVKEKVSLNGTIADKLLCTGNNLTSDINSYLNGKEIGTTYQWRLNDIDITDISAKTSSLNILNINKEREGKYSVIANNSCGASTLNLFKLTVNTAPEIITQPVAGFVCEGKTFTNSVFVANATQLPLSYQWFKDGNSIANNATAQQLVLQNIAAADQGLYAVRVSNTCGTTLSSSARLSLIGNPVITQQPTSITSCAGIENIATIVGSSTDNALVYKWYKDGILLADQISNQLIFSKILTTDIGAYKSVITNSCGLSATSNTFQVVVNDKIKIIEAISNKTVCVGSDFETDLASNLKGADLSSKYQWKLNGIDILSNSAKTNKIQLLNVTKANSGKYSILATNNCGAAIIDLFNLGITNLPAIETHPIEGSVCENLDWSNKVVTSNADQIGFTYQWYKDGVALSGATQPTIYVSNLNSSNKGLYSVKLSSACGDVMSQSALLQVRPTPQIDIALVGTPPMQCIDNNLFTFKSNIFISDNSMVDLTWDFGNGVTSKQSQVSHSYGFANDFNVYLFAKSIYGCKDTAVQVVSVNTKPVITENIVNQILCTGAQLNYNVDVKVKPNEKVGYQWYFNQDPILNAVNKSISIDNVQKVNGGNYKLRITNACGITYSTEAELKIAEKPIVTVPLPINYKVCDGFETVLQPTVYSLLPKTFQWYKNELPYVGRESDTLRIKQFGTQDVATYAVSITNKCGTTYSIPGNLIMKNIAWSTQSLVSDTICYQTDTKLALKDFANNDDTLIFSWFKDGLPLTGVNTKDFSINKFIINDTGYYAAKLTNSCGILNVPVAKLTLNKVNAAFSLDTLDACKGSLIINGLDTTQSLFRIRDNYWQIKELSRTLGSTPGMRFQFSNSGTYTIRHAVTDIKGCNSDTVSKIVINYGKPTASFTINDTCMTTPSIALNNSVFGHASSKLTKYTWNFGDTTIIRNTSIVPSYTYKTAGPKSLQLIVESDSSCVADTMTKKLMVYGNPVASFVTQDSCQGFPVLFTNRSFTQFTPDSVGRFSWNFDDGATSSLRNPQNIFKEYGAYKIKLTAFSANCPFLTDDTTINMTIKSPRANQVYPRIQTVKRVVGQMNAIGNGRSYAWLPYTGLTDTKIKNPKFSITEDKITYTITIVDSAGCVNNDKQEVWAFTKPDIYLATGFSPNNDGVNDKYKPEYIEIKILEYFRVQDSNNRQVFITNSLTDKWDGTYNGNPLPPAPYLVSVAGIDIQGNRIVKQGIVIVVK